MRATVDEVARVARAEGIDAHVAKGGTIRLARGAAQLARARAEVEEARHWGRDADDLALLDAAEATGIVRADGVAGATYTPDCAAIHPARLVRGLARAAERRGVTIHERTRVTSIAPREVRTEHGVVRARTVVRATEGFTPQLPGHRRTSIPVYSLVIATDPIPDATWAEIGLARRETFSDFRHLLVYGQRTADDRIVFGGRGAPYHRGSRIRPSYDRDERVFATAADEPRRPVPGAPRRTREPRVGRPSRRAAGLVRLGRPRPVDRPGVGRRLRGRRGRHHQPGRADAAGPRPRPRHRPHPAPLGQPPLAEVGARAAALARRQRGPARVHRGRPRGVADPTSEPARAGRLAVDLADGAGSGALSW